tara:strand:+ start:744 stop:983 length:240 start_codon:yes stop_codon:yes gene_type:complete
MGKMKEEYLNYWLKNPDASDAEYQDWLHSQGYRKVTMEEKQSEHDDWWDSLTNEQKQQLYNDQEEAFKLTIEEMNHERE